MEQEHSKQKRKTSLEEKFIYTVKILYYEKRLKMRSTKN